MEAKKGKRVHLPSLVCAATHGCVHGVARERGYSGDEDKAHFGQHSILSLGI